MKISELARLSSWWEINKTSFTRHPFRVLSLGESWREWDHLEGWRAFTNAAIEFTGVEPDAEIVEAARVAFPCHTWVHLSLRDVRDYYDEGEVWDLILVGSDVDPHVIDFAFERAVLWVAVTQRGDTPLLDAPPGPGIDEFVRHYDDGGFTIFERI